MHVRVGPQIMSCLQTANIDLESLDASTNSRAVGGLRVLLEGLEYPLTILIRRRPFVPTVEQPDQSQPLAAALQSWLTSGEAGWRQTIVVVVAASTPADLRSRVHALRTTLDAAAITTKPIQGDALRRLVDEATRPQAEHWDRLESSDSCRAAAGIVKLPGVPVGPGWLAPLLHVHVCCDIALRFDAVDRRTSMAVLRRRLRDQTSRQMVSLHSTSLGDPFAEAALENVIDLRRRLAFGESRPLAVSVCAVAHSATTEELSRDIRTIEDAITQTTARAARLHFRQRDAVAHASVLAAPGPAPAKLMTAEAAVTMMPWHEADLLEEGGYVLGRAVGSRLPVRFDPFDSSVRTNANIAVFASSGQGKSFAVGTLILEAARCGRGVVIVDPEGEYRSTVTAIGGTYIDFRSDGAGFDVLSGGDDLDNRVETAVEFVALLAGGSFNATRRAQIGRTVREFLRRGRGGKGSVRRLARALENAWRAALMPNYSRRRRRRRPIGRVHSPCATFPMISFPRSRLSSRAGSGKR
jgi:hypothetical protein